MKYQATIGLEIHVELKMRTKMFCDSINNPDERHPNLNVCPICMGHPGTLPVINKEAVRKVLTVGRAMGGELAEYSQFDRKNYFYPDLPKGYQISQYKYPLVSGGELKGIKITRVHLEEETGKLIHGKDGSLVDFNRAGIPLMELVTEPVIKSGEEAVIFAKEFQLILRYLDVSDADMERGQMRVEVNISLQKNAEKLASLRTGITGNPTEAKLLGLGTKVEIKNLNSFRAVEQAINYEIERQGKILDEGKKVVQETRGWDENKQATFSQREKEESHDYRYFPEPDLPCLEIKNLKLEIGTIELPQQKRERFKKKYNLKDEQMEIFIRDKKFADYFEAVASEIKEAQLFSLITNYLVSDLQGLMKEKILSFDELLMTPENFAELINMIAKEEINSRAAKDVLRMMVERGGDPSVIVEELGLRQITDEAAINNLADKIISENPAVAEEYKKGKEASLQFLIGQGMKETKGSVNPETLKKALKQKLK